jgi:hypothetical protein
MTNNPKCLLQPWSYLTGLWEFVLNSSQIVWHFSYCSRDLVTDYRMVIWKRPLTLPLKPFVITITCLIRSEVLTGVTMNSAVFRLTACLALSDPEDRCSMFLQNNSKRLPCYTAPRPRRCHSIHSCGVEFETFKTVTIQIMITGL